MTSFSYIVLVSCESNISIQVTSLTNDPERRIQQLKHDIKVARGEAEGTFYHRFAQFIGVKEEDITFEVFKKVVDNY